MGTREDLDKLRRRYGTGTDVLRTGGTAKETVAALRTKYGAGYDGGGSVTLKPHTFSDVINTGIDTQKLAKTINDSRLERIGSREPVDTHRATELPAYQMVDFQSVEKVEPSPDNGYLRWAEEKMETTKAEREELQRKLNRLTGAYQNEGGVPAEVIEQMFGKGFRSVEDVENYINQLSYQESTAPRKYYNEAGQQAVEKFQGKAVQLLADLADQSLRAREAESQTRYGFYGSYQDTMAMLDQQHGVDRGKMASLKAGLEQLGYSAEDIDRAVEYLVEAGFTKAAYDKAAKQAEGNGLLNHAAAAFAAPLNLFDFLYMRSQTSGRNDTQDLANYKPSNAGDLHIALFSREVTSGVTEKIRGEDPNAWRNTLAFLYNTGFSAAQSTAITKAFGPASTIFMGGQAAASTALEVIERGGTNDQAMWSGVAAGAAEALFEAFSVDSLLKGKGDKKFWQFMLKQAGIEATEEVNTEVANILADAYIMQGNSKSQNAIRAHMADGKTREEAERLVFVENVEAVVLAGVGGFLSGGFSSAVAAGPSSAYSAIRGTNRQKAADAVFDRVEQERVAGQKNTAPEMGTVAETMTAPAAATPVLEWAAQQVSQAGAVTNSVAERVMADAPSMAELGLNVDGMTASQKRSAVKTALPGWMERTGRTQTEVNSFEQAIADTAAQGRQMANQQEAAEQTQQDEQMERLLAEMNGKTVTPASQLAQESAAVPAGETTLPTQTALQTASEEAKPKVGVVDSRTNHNAAPLRNVLDNREVLYLEAVSRATGMRINIVDASDNADGWYENGEIFIAENCVDPVNWIATHEVTHHLEKAAPEAYAGYLERVKAILSQEGDLQKMIEEKQAYYAENGITLTEDGALRELAANFTERLMLDENLFNRVAREDRSLAQRILDSLKEFIRRIRTTWSGQEIRQLENTRKAWEKALRESRGKTVESGERQYLYDGGAAYAASNRFANMRTEFAGAETLKGESRAEPTETETMASVDNNEVLYSLKFNTAFMDAADRMNRRNGLVAMAVMREAAKVRQAVADIFNDPDIADSLGLPPDIIGKTYIPNGSYSGTEENTTECIRTLAADDLMDAVAEYLGRPLTVEDTIAISQEYWKYTDKPECLYCYVAMDRKAHREFLGSYLQQRDDVIKNIESGMSKEEAYQKFLDGRKDTAPMKKRFDMWVSNIGKETISSADLASRAAMEKAAEKNASFKAQVNDALKYAQSASWAKKRITYTAYDNHILKWKQSRIDNLNSNYGLRMYSFSDFSPAFILENMQMITDAAVRGLKVLAYTKELDFVRIFAKTGMNINISVFGYDAASGVAMDAMQGANWGEAYELRKKHPNVGVTFVATNDDQIEWALEQDWIDVVIPFHMVRTGTKVASAFGWKNYTAMSADTKGESWTKENAKHILPPAHQNDKATYLKACKDNNLTPRFVDWVYHPNYMKLVNETRQSEGDTNPVQPLFDLDAAKASIETMRKQGGYYTPIGGSRENMLDIAEEIGKKINGKIQNRQNSIRGAREHEQSAAEAQRQGKRLEERAAFQRANVKNTAKPGAGELDKIAGGLLKDFSSQYDRKEMTAQLERLYDRLAKGGLSGKALAAEAESLARRVLTEVSIMGEEGAQLRRELRQTKIHVPRELWADFEAEGGYTEFRRKYMGKLQLSGETGQSIDEVYEDLSVSYPGVFDMDAVEDPVNRLLQIAEVADSLRFVSENLSATDRVNVELLAGEMVERLYDLAQKGQPLSEVRAKDRKAATDRLRETVAKRERESARKVESIRKSNREANMRQRERMNTTKLRDSIKKHAFALGRKLTQPTDKQHIPEHLRGSVLALLEVIDLESKFGYEFTREATFRRVGQDEGVNLEPTSRTSAARALKAAYEQLRSDPEFSGVVDPDLADMLEEIAEMGNIRVADMNMEQLRTVWNAVRAVEASVTKSDKMLGASKYGKISSAADAMRAELGHREDRKNYVGALGRIDQFFNLDLLTPETFLHRMGKVGEDLNNQLRAAQDRNVEILREGIDLYKQAMKDTGVDLLKAEKELHTFELPGGTIELTAAQVMELYALSRRQAAMEHIYKGGLRAQGGKKGLVKTGKSKAVKVTFTDVADIIGVLSKEQKAFVDTLQHYMSSQLAAHGNDASMEAYGYEKFKEKFYWPIKVAPSETDTDAASEAKAKTIPGFGMTKALKPHANNSVVLRSALDSFNEHLNQMATYAAWLTTSENITKLVNYDYMAEGNRTGTVKDLLMKVYGEGGEQYLDTLLSNIAQGTKTGAGKSAITESLFGKWKAAKVGANIRVILQQPTAIIRAAEMIDAKYLAQVGNPIKGWEKAVAWAPIAQWKDWGYFEMDTGRSMRELTAGTASKLDKVKNASMWAAGKMDNIAWGMLWNAVEAETKAKHADLKAGSDEYYQAVAKRFGDVINRTQVVDSVLHRTQIMRSSNALNRFATSFMSEPSKVYNMVARDIYDIVNAEKGSEEQKRAWKHMARTGVALVASFVVNALAQSAVDALRDDDREKEYGEKFLEAYFGFTGEEEGFGEHWKSFWSGNVTGNLNPIGYIPYVKDVQSIWQGFTVDRPDMEGLADLANAAKTFAKAAAGEGNKTLWNAGLNMALKGLDAIGLPASNLKRDLMAMYSSVLQWTGAHWMTYQLDKTMLKIGESGNSSVFCATLIRAMNDDYDAYVKIYNDMVKSGMSPEDIEIGMDRQMAAELGLTKLSLLPIDWKAPGKDAAFDKKVKSRIESEKSWEEIVGGEYLGLLRELDALKAEGGKTSVTDAQKRRHIADANYSERIKEQAMERVLGFGTAANERYAKARSAGISTKAFVDLLDAIEAATVARKGEKGSPNQDDVEKALNKSTLTAAQKRAIWYSYGWKSESPWG